MKIEDNRYPVIALIGKSGSGKTTLQKKLVESFECFHAPIAYTTRPQRENEKFGEPYWFVKHENFPPSEDILIESKYNDWRYIFAESDFKKDKINVIVVDYEQLHQLYEKSDKIVFFVVYVIVSDKIKLIRSLEREENPDCYEICRRFLADKEEYTKNNFNEDSYLVDETYVNENDDLLAILTLPKLRDWLFEKLLNRP